MTYNNLYILGCWLVAAFMLSGVCAIWWLTEKVEKLQRENEELQRENEELRRENEELRRVVEIADGHAKIMQDYEAPYKASPTAIT